MSDAEQQSDLLHAKDQQQVAADQQVLRHMLSRVSTRGLQRQHCVHACDCGMSPQLLMMWCM